MNSAFVVINSMAGLKFRIKIYHIPKYAGEITIHQDCQRDANTNCDCREKAAMVISEYTF